MKRLLFILLLFPMVSLGQAKKVAVLDFENTSGIAKYDGLGKAMSNMLITDFKNHVHPRKVVFMERSQLNKILEEQNLQKTKNFDKNTAVDFGKLAGVDYVIIGSVYVLDQNCNITSRMVNVQTSEIILSKEANGVINNWLEIKSSIATEILSSLNNPVSIEKEYTEQEISENLLVQYSKIIDKIDDGDLESAQEMTEMLSSIQPDFKYFEELTNDIKIIKEQIVELERNVELLKETDKEIKENITNLTDDVSEINNKLYEIENKINEGIIITNPSTLEGFLVNSMIYYNMGNYVEAEESLVEVFKREYLKYDLILMFFDILNDNYNADYDAIELQINKYDLHQDIFQLAYIDFSKQGLDYYIELDKFNRSNTLEDEILLAFLQNKKAKGFYADVPFRDSSFVILTYFSEIFCQNENKLGKNIIKSKHLFFNYTSSLSRYFSNTSYSNDENSAWRFYTKNCTVPSLYIGTHLTGSEDFEGYWERFIK